MKKSMLAILAILAMVVGLKAQIVSTPTGKVSFFSKTPVEDINATNKNVKALMNINTREVAVIIENINFVFVNKLMEEHFNEKYMETDKNPLSGFKGKIAEEIDITKDGVYQVNLKGKLNIHGVEQERTIPGTLTVKDGKYHFVGTFKVKNADHKIEIPTIVTAKIAEAIDVTIELDLAPKVK